MLFVTELAKGDPGVLTGNVLTPVRASTLGALIALISVLAGARTVSPISNRPTVPTVEELATDTVITLPEIETICALVPTLPPLTYIPAIRPVVFGNTLSVV